MLLLLDMRKYCKHIDFLIAYYSITHDVAQRIHFMALNFCCVMFIAKYIELLTLTHVLWILRRFGLACLFIANV